LSHPPLSCSDKARFPNLGRDERDLLAQASVQFAAAERLAKVQVGSRTAADCAIVFIMFGVMPSLL
jgi:hypothetical protein